MKTSIDRAGNSAIPVSAALRAARQADIASVEALLTAASLPLAGLSDALPGMIVAEENGRIVGTAALEVRGENALLRSVAVAPEWRSRGLGRALVSRVIADAEARGLKAVYLLTTTAERYFPSFGFTTTTRTAVPADLRATAEFCGACPESATVMCHHCAGPSRG
jgi:amino-acid N-acetyltransferase